MPSNNYAHTFNTIYNNIPFSPITVNTTKATDAAITEDSIIFACTDKTSTTFTVANDIQDERWRERGGGRRK